jgi:uncharacterized protein
VNRKPYLLDANVLIALLNTQDQHHNHAVALLSAERISLVTCWPAVTEAAYMLRRVPKAVDHLLDLCSRAPRLDILEITRDEIPAISTWMRKYHAIKPDFADACLMHLAERHKLDSILTFDDDFDTYRTTTGRAIKRLHA